MNDTPNQTAERVCDVIAETIRRVDGRHSMGAGALGEHIEEALRAHGLLSEGTPSEAQVEAAAKVLAPDGVFAEDFGEYSRKRDNYRREDQAEERRYYMRKARAALEAADVASQEVIDDAADEQDDLRLHMLAPQPACLNCDEPVAESVDGVGLRAERDAALAAIERVRAEADAYAEQPDVMEPCGAVAQALRTALDGAPEPEEKP